MQDPNQASQNPTDQPAEQAAQGGAQQPAQSGPELDLQAAAAAADTAPENGIDSMPSLEEALRQAELKAAEHHDAWLRAKAETENLRRRAQDDIAKASKFAAEKFATAMLPVKDSLEAALATENQTVEKMREGVELTLRQLISAFEGAKLAEENPLGQKFDPNKHQAISMVEADAEPNTVVTVLQKGYLLSERVIRPAMVMVSKGKAQYPPQANSRGALESASARPIFEPDRRAAGRATRIQTKKELSWARSSVSTSAPPTAASP